MAANTAGEGPFSRLNSSLWQVNVHWLLAAPAIALLIPMFLFPILILLRNSFNRDVPGALMTSDVTIANYWRLFSDPFYLNIFANSVGVAALVAIISLAFGYPFAYYLVRFAGRSRQLLLWIIYTPILVSVITRVFGWIIITSDNGILNSILLKIGAIHSPLHILFDFSGMMIGIVHRYLPLMILPLANALAKTDPRLLDASLTLGATRRETFLRVTLPLSLPGMVAGTQLCLAAVLSDFVLPTLMGSSRFRLIAPAIYDEAIGNLRWSLAAAMAIVMLAVMAAILAAINITTRKLAPWQRGI